MQKFCIFRGKIIEKAVVEVLTGVNNMANELKRPLQAWDGSRRHLGGGRGNVNENFHRTHLPSSHFLRLPYVFPPLHLCWTQSSRLGCLPVIFQRFLMWKLYAVLKIKLDATFSTKIFQSLKLQCLPSQNSCNTLPNTKR